MHIIRESVEVGAVGGRRRAHHEIVRRHLLQGACPIASCEFAQPTLESVALDGRMLEARDDDPDAVMMQKGSEDPNLEQRGTDSLPFASDQLEVGRARQPLRRRHAAIDLRRPRTSTGASRSGACAPSCGGG